MKIVAISDTHMRQPKLPEGDVLVHSGDATFHGSIEEVSKFGAWWNKLEYKHKIFIPGNHDWLFQRSEHLARQMIESIVLIDQAVEIDGIKFYGSPWQPWFYDWAFNLERGEEIKAKWDLIPDGTDVLVTHGPPNGFLDYVPSGGNVGCKDLLDAVCRVRPKYHIFGHIHYSRGEKYWEHTGTTFMNAAICDEAYMASNTPIVFDI